MKVLISAYACDPGATSEPGVGWSWARAAALAGHEVWLVTRENNKGAIDAALIEDSRLDMIPIYVDLPERWRQWKRGQRGVRSYYALWQIWAGRRMEELHSRYKFDVGHHVTLAVDWLPATITKLKDLPVIWGPVGGTTQVPWPLIRYLGVRGGVHAIARAVIGGLGRRLWGRAAARRAAITVALNEDVANWFGRWGRTIIEPNSAFDIAEFRRIRSEIAEGSTKDRKKAVFVGRLEPWKGLMLALEVMKKPSAAAWDLTVYGDGVDMVRARKKIVTSGLQDRIKLQGKVPRGEVLAAIASADALIHPAFHDSSPWTVGEAVTLGTPVVCLSSGGPRTLAEMGRIEVVTPSWRVADDLALVLQRLERKSLLRPTDRWSSERLPPFLDALYREAVSVRSTASGARVH